MATAGAWGAAGEGGRQLPKARANGKALWDPGRQGETIFRQRRGAFRLDLLPESKKLVQPLNLAYLVLNLVPLGPAIPSVVHLARPRCLVLSC